MKTMLTLTTAALLATTSLALAQTSNGMNTQDSGQAAPMQQAPAAADATAAETKVDTATFIKTVPGANAFEIEELLEEGFTEKELRIGVETAAGAEHEAEEVELRPFKQTHVLLSFPPEKMLDVQDHLDAIREIEGVEVEIGSN